MSLIYSMNLISVAMMLDFGNYKILGSFLFFNTNKSLVHFHFSNNVQGKALLTQYF